MNVREAVKVYYNVDEICGRAIYAVEKHTEEASEQPMAREVSTGVMLGRFLKSRLGKIDGVIMCREKLSSVRGSEREVDPKDFYCSIMDGSQCPKGISLSTLESLKI